MRATAHVLACTWAGGLRRCPRCRRGRMYDGFYGMRDTCAACGHLFEPSPGEFTGGLMLAQGVLGVVGAVGFIWLWMRESQPWMQYAWLGFWLVVVPILFYPNIKGAWLGFLHGVRSRPRPPLPQEPGADAPR